MLFLVNRRYPLTKKPEIKFKHPTQLIYQSRPQFTKRLLSRIMWYQNRRSLHSKPKSPFLRSLDGKTLKTQVFLRAFKPKPNPNLMKSSPQLTKWILSRVTWYPSRRSLYPKLKTQRPIFKPQPKIIMPRVVLIPAKLNLKREIPFLGCNPILVQVRASMSLQFLPKHFWTNFPNGVKFALFAKPNSKIPKNSDVTAQLSVKVADT